MTKEYIIEGAGLIEDGIIDFKEWSKRMIKEFGAVIVPQLKSIWDESNSFAESSKIAENKILGTITDTSSNSEVEKGNSAGLQTFKSKDDKNKQQINSQSLLNDFKPNSILFLLISIFIILNPPYLVNKYVHPEIWNGPKFTEREFHFLFKSPINSELELSLLFVELIIALIISILVQKLITFFSRK